MSDPTTPDPAQQPDATTPEVPEAPAAPIETAASGSPSAPDPVTPPAAEPTTPPVVSPAPVTPPSASPVTPPAAPSAAPAYAPAGSSTTPPPAAPAYTPATPVGSSGGRTPILSILSLVASGLGILGFWIVFIPIVGGILGLFFPGAGVVLGFLGKAKEKTAPKGLWMAGIILGFVGLAIALLSILLWAALFATSNAFY